MFFLNIINFSTELSLVIAGLVSSGLYSEMND